MKESNKQKIEIKELKNVFDLEETLIRLNRVSHFIEDQRFTRYDIFKRTITINFYSYFIDNSYYVDRLVERLKKKVLLLNDNEYQIDDPDIKSYVTKIWEDIFVLLDLFDEHILKVIKRFENGISSDFKIDILDLEKTNIFREIVKLQRPIENNAKSNP